MISCSIISPRVMRKQHMPPIPFYQRLIWKWKELVSVTFLTSISTNQLITTPAQRNKLSFTPQNESRYFYSIYSNRILLAKFDNSLLRQKCPSRIAFQFKRNVQPSCFRWTNKFNVTIDGSLHWYDIAFYNKCHFSFYVLTFWNGTIRFGHRSQGRHKIQWRQNISQVAWWPFLILVLKYVYLVVLYPMGGKDINAD